MTQTGLPRPVRDGSWFDGLFQDHARAVFRYIARRAARDDVDDLTADVFATAWTRREDVPEGHELPWLFRTAGFTVANHHRKGRPTPVEALPDDGDTSSPEVLVVADLQMRAVFATLGARDRQILLLSAWEGLHGEALAEVLGVSRGGADAALSRARSRLHEAWQRSEADGARSADAATQTR